MTTGGLIPGDTAFLAMMVSLGLGALGGYFIGTGRVMTKKEAASVLAKASWEDRNKRKDRMARTKNWWNG